MDIVANCLRLQNPFIFQPYPSHLNGKSTCGKAERIHRNTAINNAY